MPELESLALGTLLLATAIVFASGLSHGAIGFGFPMLSTPLLAVLFDVRTAILLTLLPTIAVNIPSILRGGNWAQSIGTHWPLAIYVPLGTIAGTLLLVEIDPSPFRLLLAAVILLYLLQPRIAPGGWRCLQAIVSRRQLGYLLFGLTAGFLAGTVNVMVPLLIVFTMELGLAPMAMVQLFNLCFLAGKLTQLGTFSQLGLLASAPLANALPLSLSALTGLFIGIRLRERIRAETYRQLLRVVLWLFALLLVGQFAFGG